MRQVSTLQSDRALLQHELDTVLRLTAGMGTPRVKVTHSAKELDGLVVSMTRQLSQLERIVGNPESMRAVGSHTHTVGSYGRLAHSQAGSACRRHARVPGEVVQAAAVFDGRGRH